MIDKRKKFNLLIAVALALCLLSLPCSAAEIDETAPVPELKLHKVEVPVPVTVPTKIDTLYSWSLREADIRDVLLTFAKGSKTNIIVEPDVSGQVTVDLNQVSFDKVLDYLLHPLGLEYSKTEDFVQVFKPRLETLIFQIDYVNSQRIGKGSLTVNATKESESLQSSSTASIENTTNADFWATLIDALNTMVFEEKGDVEAGAGGAFSKKDKSGRQLIINPQSGVVLVTETKNKIEDVTKFIEALKVSIQRQVMIQAKIIEITLSDDFDMGINWSYIADFPKLSSLGGSLAGGALLSQKAISGAGNSLFQLGVSNNHVSALLDAMAQQGNLNILSSPQIVTLNNQTAMIKVTQETVYFQISTTVESDTNTTTENIESKTIDVGIVLDVTPQISSEGMIILNIHPSISEIVGQAVSKKGDTRPIIDRRESNAVVKVQDGQTIVMAGLMKEKKKETIESVPCLGEIPFLGLLFRHNVQLRQKVELVIMLTPLILNETRIDMVRKQKETAIKKADHNLHLGVPPHEEGVKGERK